MLKKKIRRLWQVVYRLYGVRKNVTTGPDLHLGIGSIIEAPRRMAVGRNVHIGKFCTIECDGNIGDYVAIANNVGLIGRYDHDHEYVGKPIVSAPWIGDADYKGKGKELEIVVEDDVWIGYGAIILSGVKIGRGALIGAGSVVFRDIPPYAVVMGNPARPVARRFTDDEMGAHEGAVYGRIVTPRQIVPTPSP